MTELNIEQERLEFEATNIELYEDHSFDRFDGLHSDKYHDPYVQLGWTVWLSAKRAAMGSAEPMECFECGDDITSHDPGICGNCYAIKYRDAPSSTKEASTMSKLPELPWPAMPHGSLDYFSAGQMRAYAKLAIASTKREPLSDKQIDDAQEQAYLTLRAQGFNGGMGGLQWDRASARAIEHAHGIIAPTDKPGLTTDRKEDQVHDDDTLLNLLTDGKGHGKDWKK